MPRTRNATPAAYYQGQPPPWSMHAGAAPMYPVPHLAGGGLGRRTPQPVYYVVTDPAHIPPPSAVRRVKVPPAPHGHKGRRTQQERIQDAKHLARLNKIQVLKKTRNQLLAELASLPKIRVLSRVQLRDVLGRVITHHQWLDADVATINTQIRKLEIFSGTFVEKWEDTHLNEFIENALKGAQEYAKHQAEKATRRAALPAATKEHQDTQARLTSLRH